MTWLKTRYIEGESKYQYPSAGSTYAVQLYIHLKQDAVEDLDEGIYYYHPKEHKIFLITGINSVVSITRL